MTIDAALDVMLKGADVVADTALLTLRGKMGYESRLLAVTRSEAYAFRIECRAPAETAAALKRFLNTQSLFYNRNKHRFSLRCRWEGGGLDEGAAPDRRCREISARVQRVLAAGTEKDFHSGSGAGRVILTNGPVFRTEVLVEDLDAAAKDKAARKLEAELSTAPVTVPTLGICWHLALRADTPEDARAMTEEIVEARRRDRGLLSNPNYQCYRFLGAEKMEAGG